MTDSPIDRFRSLIVDITDRVIKLKMVAIGSDEEWDQGEATNTVFHDNYQAKELLKQAQEIIDANNLTHTQDDLWKLDDQRSFESRAAWLRVRKRKLGVSESEWVRQQGQDKIFAFGNCDVMGNRFVYDVTIKNASDFVITNVTSNLVAYPQDCMKLATDSMRTTPRIEVGGFISDKFVLLPSKDCVEGRVVCVVSFIDHRDSLHTLHVEPYIIRSVCDLLRPLESSSEQFTSAFAALIGGCREMKLEWNANVLLEKAESLLPAMNFYLIDVEKREVGKDIVGTIRGYALGKYTGKRVAVAIHITGPANGDSSTAKVEVSGDDEAMLPTTIHEIAEKIDSWVCIKCGARLNPDQVMQIEAKGVLNCRYCATPLSLDLYTRTSKKPKAGRSEIVSETLPGSADEETIGVELSPARKGMPAGQEIDESTRKLVEGVTVLRGCEVIGGRFEYKVKVSNNSQFVVTNVAVTVVGYPKDAMEMVGESSKTLARVEVGGFRSPQFSFTPTKDCVEGKILATVSFIDFMDNVHTQHVQPYIIKSVCDLLQPLEATPLSLDAAMKDFTCSDREYELEWNAEVVFKRTEKLLPAKNFYLVDRDEQVIGDEFIGTLRGFAEGKYTKKKVAAVITVKGPRNGRSSFLKIESLGEDISMLPTTIEELGDSIEAWSCLFCGSSLQTEEVLKMKAKVPIKCKSCGHSLSLEIYRK
ncbi:MAG: hypothetical protein EAX95_07650 [Candidatus Thorarchaeota archaeon]|nr:hypothetical protein [Candidatus Thorarchaeota archaeon]